MSIHPLPSAARRRLIAVFAGVLAFLGPLDHAAAQVTYDGCFDPLGVPVASVASNVQNVAVANRDQFGSPYIEYNPNIIAWLQPITRLFWYMHECGHHVLGHTLGFAIPTTVEQEADCWAIRTMWQRGMVNEQGVQVISDDISKMAGDWTHLPGPQRAFNLFQCLQQ